MSAAKVLPGETPQEWSARTLAERGERVRPRRTVQPLIAEQRKVVRAEVDLRRREALEFTPRRSRPELKPTLGHRDATVEAAAAVDFPRFRRVRLACCEHVGPSTDLDLHAAQIVLTLAGMATA